MSTCVLPAELRRKIDALVRHIRRAQLLRGVGLTLLTGLALFAVVFVVDCFVGFVDLSPLALAWILSGVLGTIGMAFVALVIAPALRPLDVRGLAALVEERYPELAERLTTSVELSEAAGLGHGSAALIRFLQEDTATQASGLDFLRAYPVKSSRVLALAALALVGLTTLLAIAWDRFGDFTSRFATAWQMRSPFAIEVEHADVVGKGRPWTVSARLLASSSRPLPAECFLVIHEGDATRRLRMQADEAGRFSAPIGQVPESFVFRIEAGPVASEDRRVTAITPVDLLPGRPTLTIQPPRYVNQDVHPPRVTQGIQDVSAFEYGAIRLDFRFTRPAVAGSLHLRPAKMAAGKPTDTALPLSFVAHRQEAELVLPALEPGADAVKLTLEAEHGIVTERELGTITISADTPPRFSQALDNFRVGEPTRAAPDDVLFLRVGVEDDLGLDRVDLEYRVNGGPAQVETIVQGDGKRQVRRDYRFHLTGRVKEGDRLLFRLKATDNRQVARGIFRDLRGEAVPLHDLAAHVVHEPTAEAGKDRWFAVEVRAKATPLHEKEILARRDALQQQIEEIQKRLAGERSRVQELRPDIRKYPTITPEQANQLTDIRALNLAVQKGLQRLAEEAGKQPVIGGLESLARDIIAAQMQPADDAFQKAQDPHLAPDKREPMIEQADDLLALAQKRLDELARSNERLAQDRLDHLHMEKLARQQDLLAKRAARLSGQENEPSAQAELAEIRAEQKRLREEMERLTRKSRLFREGMEAAGQNPVESFRQQLMKLAKAQRELAKRLLDNPSSKETTKELARQKEEMERTLRELTQLSQSAESEKARELAMHALAAAEKAQQAMKQAEAEAGKGSAKSAEHAAQLAARMLDQAEKKAAELGLQLTMEKKASEPELAKLGESLKQGQDQADRAEKRLAQREAEQAAEAMKQAAQAMQQAADLAEQRLTRPQRGKIPIAGNTPGKVGPVMGPLLTGELAKELEKHAGRPWGELPGELRTRIVNDLRARYGDDFSRIIQGYFESLSDASRDDKR